MHRENDGMKQRKLKINNNNNNIIIIIMLQEISNEQLSKGANKAADAWLDVHARGFKQWSAFFDVWVSFPNADTCKDLELSNIYKLHEVKKKRKYAERVNEIEHRTFRLRSTTASSLNW